MVVKRSGALRHGSSNPGHASSLLLNEGCKVLLQITQSVINGGQTRRMTSWTYPMEERKKKQTSRAIKYYISNVRL